jgi:hypothetical protein
MRIRLPIDMQIAAGQDYMINKISKRLRVSVNPAYPVALMQFELEGFLISTVALAR